MTFTSLILLSSRCDLINNSAETESDFSIKDTANIIKFKISDTENNSITISRNNEQKSWMIEGSDYLAQQNNVELILETFYRIRIKQDVPEKGVENVLTNIAVRHKKIEIFMKGDENPIKTWYIGSPTKDHLGTNMLLQNGTIKNKVPYITYKPGVNGTLDTRFFTSWVDWRGSGVFNYADTREISKIQIEFPQDPIESYTILRNNDASVSLLGSNKMNISFFDSVQVKHYFTHYHKIHYNKIVFEESLYIDSVFSSNTYLKIYVTDKNNEITLAEIWKIKMPIGTVDDNGTPINYDPSYGYLRVNGVRELLRIQYLSWDLLFKPLSYYLPMNK